MLVEVVVSDSTAYSITLTTSGLIQAKVNYGLQSHAQWTFCLGQDRVETIGLSCCYCISLQAVY